MRWLRWLTADVGVPRWVLGAFLLVAIPTIIRGFAEDWTHYLLVVLPVGIAVAALMEWCERRADEDTT